MQLDFNVYALILLVFGIGAGILSLFILYRLNVTVKWFAFTLLCGSIWSFFYGLELASLSFSAIYFWIKFEYIAIALIPFTWLIFSFKYTDNRSWLNKKPFLWLLFLVSMITYIMVLTNEGHHLYYKSVGLHTGGAFPLLDIQKGPWYYMFTFYFYFIILWGNYLLISNIKFAEPVFKRQTSLLVMSTSVPMLFHLLHFMGFRILGNIDVTPFAFIISFCATGLGLIKYNLFDVVPIAKEQLVAAMTDGLLVIDEKKRIIEINPAMKKIMGDENQKYIGIPLFNLWPRQDLLDIVRRGGHESQELTEGIEETERVFVVESIPLKGREGRSKGTLLIFKDVTELKNIQRLLESQTTQLKKLNEQKDKLFSIISHDLKGPVLGVKEILDLSKKGYMTADDFAEILPALSNSMDGVTMLLENLLAWSRTQLRGEFTDKAVFDIHKLVQEQKTLMEPVAALKEVKLEVESEGSIMVFADKNMVELVIRNLLNNAVKFCGIGDRILLRVINKKDDIKISVKDTGAGISQANLLRLRSGEVFSTFGSNNESGTGLGLLLVREYVEKNGGEFWIDSEENEWSEFSFALPKISIN